MTTPDNKKPTRDEPRVSAAPTSIADISPNQQNVNTSKKHVSPTDTSLLDRQIDMVITKLRAGHDPDTKRLHITDEEAKQSILALIATQVAEAVRLARIDTWKRVRKSYPKSNARAMSVSKFNLSDIDREITALQPSQLEKEQL